jgi:hypothetical protein
LKAISEKHGSGVDSLPAAISTAALLPAEANGVTGDSRFEPFSENLRFQERGNRVRGRDMGPGPAKSVHFEVAVAWVMIHAGHHYCAYAGDAEKGRAPAAGEGEDGAAGGGPSAPKR